MEVESDILREIPNEELPLLSDFYSKHFPHTTYVYSFLNTMIRWRKTQPEKELFKLYVPEGDWRSDGTFLALLQFNCYDIFLFTMDPMCERLYDALCNTKRIDYKNNKVHFYALHRRHRDAVGRALERLGLSISLQLQSFIFWMPKEEAAKMTIECPEEYYIDALRPEHAALVNQEWPHRYKNSAGYVRTLIEMNAGLGVFTKADNKLVSWCLKNALGILGVLQTLPEYRRKGLASLMTKALSKEITKDGHNPVGTVLLHNEPSKAMFTKLNFRIIDIIFFLNIGE